MLNIWQRSPLWKDTPIGKSKDTIGESGCLISALCSTWSKFHYNPKNRKYLRPDEAVKEWEFTSIEGDKDPKYIVWNSINDSGMEFVWREYGYNPTGLMEDPETHLVEVQGDLLKKWLKSSNYGVVFRVQTRSGGEHWLAGWRWSITGKPVCLDPWSKKTLWNPWGFMGTYIKCTGFAVLKSK